MGEFGGFEIFVVAALVLAIVLVFMGVKSVPQGMEWTVERFGRYTRTLEPGLQLIMPFIDRIGAKMNMMETVLDVPSQEVITKDNAMVGVDGVVFYQVLDAAKAAYAVRNLETAIINLTMTNIRTVMGGMDLDELLSNRDHINAALLTIVDEATNPWGVKATRIEIRDITPPRDLVDSMARQMKAERDRRATILEAEGDRQAEILRAEGMKQAAILEAEGRREAAFRDAEARERAAEAEGKATQMVSEAIASGNIHAINYFVAQRYVQALEKVASAPNQKVLMLPVEAANVIGAIGGIAELAREAFGGSDGGGGPAGAPPRSQPPRPSAPSSAGSSTAGASSNSASRSSAAVVSPPPARTFVPPTPPAPPPPARSSNPRQGNPWTS
ncbi:MAG: SPFH/Band 7/PHB domain protein [Rhodospirillaceae bacterium]|nr:SPFH/Band 7/PHB domain protein [Rhodospirillaceae bacterium]